MTVPVIACIPSYAHVRAWIAASTYVIHASNVLTKIIVCDATKFTFRTCHWYSYGILMSPDLPVIHGRSVPPGCLNRVVSIVFMHLLGQFQLTMYIFSSEQL